MNRLMMTIAIVLAAILASIGIQELKAVDAHHPEQTAKAKKTAKSSAETTPQSNKVAAKTQKPRQGNVRGQSSQAGMMNCPMMQGGQAGQAGQGGMMNCPMMSGSSTSMMQGGQGMGPGMMQGQSGMGPGMMMGQSGAGSMMMRGPGAMSRRGQCWVTTDRDRGFGYWGACGR